MDNFSNIQKHQWFRANMFFHEECILYINIRFRKHVEENLFKFSYAK